MVTSVFMSETTPEKDLKRVRRYKVYLSKEERDKILEEVCPGPIPANVDIEINTEVLIKEYSDPKRGDKNREYNGIG